MPEITALTDQIHALAQRAGDSDRHLASLFVQCIRELALATDRLTMLESWAIGHGYTGYTSTQTDTDSTETDNGE